MRNKLILNTLSALFNQVVMVLCAFILPRTILQAFGSEVNGLVSSIQQFLLVISFIEFGIGSVVQAALYKPLVERNHVRISEIVSSADKFFKKLAYGMLLYVVGLLIVYPNLVNRDFDVFYTDSLILSMCISYFAQYFIGLKNQLLVIADQKGYIHYGLNTLTLILNNVIGVILILNGFNIQFVKLATSLVLLIRPVCLHLYVKKHYKLDRNSRYSGEPIPQKWNGMAQHIATVVLNSTDTVVLTLFSTLANVSIYNVYYLVVNGLNNLVVACTSGIQSLFGNIISKDEKELLETIFSVYEAIFHFIVTFLFGSVMVLIVPFVEIFTSGVSDIDYKMPLFAFLISLANMAYCCRLPYNTVIKAAGHFKQTQNSAWVEMAINITVSVVVVARFGLIGVSIGTLAAMIYRTMYLVYYLSHNIINRNIIYFAKHALVDTSCIVLILILQRFVRDACTTFSEWVVLAIKLSTGNLLICFGNNALFFRKDLKKYCLLKKKP